MDDMKFKANNSMDVQTVKVHNEMARTLARFGEFEHAKLFLTSFAYLTALPIKLDDEGKDKNNVVHINKAELFDKFNVPSTAKDRHVRYYNMLDNMRKKTDYDIVIDEDNQVSGSMIYKIKRTRNEYLVYFDEEMSPILKQLKSHFTEYQLLSILDLHSSHSISLYNYLMSWHDYKKQGEIERRYLTTKELKELFGLSEDDYMNKKSGKFDRYNFEKYCVQKAVDDIVAHANMNIQWCKAKHKLTGKVEAYVFDFIVYPNNEPIERGGVLEDMKYKPRDIVIQELEELEQERQEKKARKKAEKEERQMTIDEAIEEAKQEEKAKKARKKKE